MGQKESTPQNAETCPYKTRVLIKHIIVLPNRQHSPRIRPPPRLPHRRPRLHQSRLPTRLQRYLAPQPPSRKQIRRIRNLLPAPRHRRRRMGPLETRYTARLWLGSSQSQQHSFRTVHFDFRGSASLGWKRGISEWDGRRNAAAKENCRCAKVVGRDCNGVDVGVGIGEGVVEAGCIEEISGGRGRERERRDL